MDDVSRDLYCIYCQQPGEITPSWFRGVFTSHDEAQEEAKRLNGAEQLCKQDRAYKLHYYVIPMNVPERFLNESEIDAATQEFYARSPVDISRIADLTDKQVQRLLMEVETRTLLPVLAFADETICERIFSNMSARASAMLKEDIEIARSDLDGEHVVFYERKLMRAFDRLEHYFC